MHTHQQWLLASLRPARRRQNLHSRKLPAVPTTAREMATLRDFKSVGQSLPSDVLSVVHAVKESDYVSPAACCEQRRSLIHTMCRSDTLAP